jgi:tryptophan synthase beta chain
MSYNVNEKRLLWRIWGAYIPENVIPVEELLKLSKITAEPEFQAEFDALLKDYVGRLIALFCDTLIWKVQH